MKSLELKWTIQESGYFVRECILATVLNGSTDDIINKIQESSLIKQVTKGYLDRQIEVCFKEKVSAQEAEDLLGSFQNVKPYFPYSATMVVVSADDDNDMKIRDVLLKQPSVEQAYVVIATRRKVSASGIVKYLDIEGGFWGVIGDDGEHYDLINLPEKFKKQGLRIKFCGKPINAASIRMWGTLVDVNSIEGIGEDKKVRPAN